MDIGDGTFEFNKITVMETGKALLVKDVMTKDPLTITPTQTLTEVKDIFKKHSFRHLPVIDGNQLVGILSETDFEKILEGARLTQRGKEEMDFLLRETPVQRIMTPHPFTVPPDTPVEEVMEVFYKDRFHAIPVMDHGQLVGIVSQHDVFYYIM